MSLQLDLGTGRTSFDAVFLLMREHLDLLAIEHRREISELRLVSADQLASDYAEETRSDTCTNRFEHALQHLPILRPLSLAPSNDYDVFGNDVGIASRISPAEADCSEIFMDLSPIDRSLVEAAKPPCNMQVEQTRGSQILQEDAQRSKVASPTASAWNTSYGGSFSRESKQVAQVSNPTRMVGQLFSDMSQCGTGSATYGLVRSQTNGSSLEVSSTVALPPKKHTMHNVGSPWCDYPDLWDVPLAHVLPQPDQMYTTSTAASTTMAMAATWLSKRSDSNLLESGSSSCFSLVHKFMFHPHSTTRICWVLCCTLLLCYDLLVVPVEISFNLESTGATDVIQWISTIFWTVDIPFTFITYVITPSHLETRPVRIAHIYITSWMPFDVFIIMPDWISLVVEGDSLGALPLARVVRWGRLMRLLRLTRFLRIAKLRPLLRHIVFYFHVSTSELVIIKGWVVMTIQIVVGLHMIACVWHGLGVVLDNGWVQANNFESTHAFHLYLISLCWSYSRLYGMSYDAQLQTWCETLVDTFLIFASLVISAMYVGRMSALYIRSASSQAARLTKISRSFANRHAISVFLQERLTKVLKAAHCNGAGERMAEENALLNAVPISLKEDLLYEARAPLMRSRVFFTDMLSANPRVLRHVCNAAMNTMIAVEYEVVFASGDACSQMLFVTSGQFLYTSPECGSKYDSFLRSTRAKGGLFRACLMEGEVLLPKGACVAEPILWTTWEHPGTLAAEEESILLTLDAQKFGNVLVLYKEACAHAVKYARHFVWRLNHLASSGQPDDLCYFDDLGMSNLDEELFNGTDQDHFIFISHYKLEAGTEASLMRDLLEVIFREDQSHPANNLKNPVFIDSEDLIDLGNLKEHVAKSTALVLLLTPGVLSRPWCLIEIVTAIKKGVPIVPVEIQRPGVTYEYPTEEFYGRLLTGKVLPSDSLTRILNEGISLQDVEDAIRHVCLKIALPFSPHRTKAVRDAELQDIVKRCTHRMRNSSKSNVDHFRLPSRKSSK